MYHMQRNVSLRKLNTYGLDVTARYFIRLENKEDLIEIFNDPLLKDISQKLVLGGGSNILFVDQYFNGLIIHMCIKGFNSVTDNESDNKVLLKVGAGEKWTDLIAYTVQHRYNGLEKLVGIPGTVGAAPVQNISAYGMELSEVFHECQVFDIENKSFTILNKDKCHFAYRESIFKQINNNYDHMRYIIITMTLILSKSTSEQEDLQSETIIKQIMKRRSANLPDPWLDVGNAGSFFLNPIVTKHQYDIIKQQEEKDIPHYQLVNNQIKLLAGWLIEQCGWKGTCLGSAGTWDSHANILVNHGSRNGHDLWILAKEIRNSVEKRFHIRLEPEVNVIRIFKPIKRMLSSKLIIKKSDLWKNEHTQKAICIPPDKNVCVHLLFTAIILRQIVCFKNGFFENISYDVTRILQWIDEHNIAHLYFHNSQSLTIVPNGYQLIDLTTAAFSRASINIAGNILLTHGVVRCVKPGGCQFTYRPIDAHLSLLAALGGHSDNGETFHLKKDWNNSSDNFEFDCRTKTGISSVGLTIHAILSCCAFPNHIQCKLTSVALEMSVRTVITLVSQYRSITVIDSERVIIFEKVNSFTKQCLVLENLPIDQIYLFTVCSFAAMLRFKLIINNFEYDQCITEYLKSIMSVIIHDSNGSALFDGTTNVIHNQNDKHELICDIYPNGLPTDISPILAALFTARNISFELTDLIYDARNTHCQEFIKIGYDMITSGNKVTYNKIKRDEKSRNLLAHDIRGGVAVLLLALYHVNNNQWNEHDDIIIQQYEQIQRGYGNLLHEKLCEFGFSIKFIYE